MSFGSLDSVLCHGWNGLMIVDVEDNDDTVSSNGHDISDDEKDITKDYRINQLSEAMLKASLQVNFNMSLNNLILAETRFNFKKHFFSRVTSYVSLNRVKTQSFNSTDGIDKLIASSSSSSTSSTIDNDQAVVELKELLRLPTPPRHFVSKNPTGKARGAGGRSYRSSSRVKTAAVLHYRPQEQDLSTFEVGFRAALDLLTRFHLLETTLVPYLHTLE